MTRALRLWVNRQPIWIIVIACILIFSLSSPYFFAFDNFINILKGLVIYGIMAIGMTILMINGNVDLSIGQVMTLSAAMAIGLQPYGMWTAIIAAMAAGAVIGAINGLFVARLHINSFIVTLATMIGVKGLVYAYTKEKTQLNTIEAFADFGSSAIAFIPTVILIYFALLLAGHFVLSHTTHGRNAYAIGSNVEAAKNAGIRVERHIFSNFVISGLLAGFAGVLIASMMNAASPSIGLHYEFTVLTAVVLGGTRLSGGYGSMLHTLGGILAIGIVQNGMYLAGLASYHSLLLMGAVLIFVIFFNAKFSRSMKWERG